MIDLSKLPKEIRDTIELKEAVDQTFSRFCVDENELLFVNSELKKIKEVEIGDKLLGTNGEYKTVKKVFSTKKDSIRIITDCLGSFVVSKDHKMVLFNGSIVKASDLGIGVVLKPLIDRGNSAKRVKSNRREDGFFAGVFLADGHASELKCEDTLSGCGTRYVSITNQDKFLLALCGKYALSKGASSFKISIVNNAEREFKSNVRLYILRIYGKDFVKFVINSYGESSGNISSSKSNLKKHIRLNDLKTRDFAKGFIDGFSSCDLYCGGKLSANAQYSISSKYICDCLVYALRMFGFKPTVKEYSRKSSFSYGKKIQEYSVITIISSELIRFLNFLDLKTKHKLKSKAVVLKIYATRDSKMRLRQTSMFVQGDVRFPVVLGIESAGIRKCVDVEVDGDNLFVLGAGLVTHNCDEEYSEILWNILAERADPGIEHSFIASIYGGQGKGKSMAALAMCCYLDPTFTVDQIFFDYNDLVHNRHKLKPNSAVLVDEQSQSFGLDSHRVMVILASLKEQLRKKSIHFFFCAPVLYEEYKSSMYLFETMFIDYETQECYAAMKTREGLTLGHVRIPYPLKMLEDGTTLASKELIAAYEAKKDAHLERLLNSKNIDVFEQRAEQVVQTPMFRKAEQIYVRKMGYIPQSSLINIINKLYPEYSAGVVPVEIAGRIKLNKELSGQWEVSGYGSKKVAAARQDARRRK